MTDKTHLPNLTYTQIVNLLEAPKDYVHQHTATMCRIDTTLCSGVYVRTSGYHGILTAGHCAKLVLEQERVNLAISPLIHHLWVERNMFDHVPMDEIKPDGPDLSFLIIQNNNVIDLIRRQKLIFYDLDNQNADIFRGGLLRFNWFVVGSPHEKLSVNTILLNNEPNRLISAEAVGLQGNLVEFTNDGKYDYMWLDLTCDTEGFPKSYIGVSGGGIWYLRFVTTDYINYTIEPILAGIAAWQSSVQNEPNRKLIKGHGFSSIYGRVRHALAEKRAANLKA